MKRKNSRVGLGLITIFGLSVGSGLMAEHVPPVADRPVAPHLRVRPPMTPSVPLRKPDSETDLKPKRRPVVAVIDTGIDFTHPDLQGHEWINDGEIADNGIDDDDNGYVDDVHGYDFVLQTGVSRDTHGHGTHIAGIVAKQAPEARIMDLKYFNRGLTGTEALKASLQAMRYAIRMKADIINYSGGGTTASPEELQVMAEASRQGILVIAAAGNEATNSERQPFYPANYKLPNILSVTAIDETNSQAIILPTSNFGESSVAVAASGKDVESTLPGGLYGRMTGTSQATAVVTGTAARILQQGNIVSPEDLIERIVTSSEVTRSLQGKTRFGSKLASKRALALRNTEDSLERAKFVKALREQVEVQARRPAYGPSF